MIASLSLPPLFALLALMLLAVVPMALAAHRLRQPLLSGYFLCGVLLANSGILGVLGLGSAQGIREISEIGVMLLMFTLGLEFSLSDLRFLRRWALWGGSAQMLCCAVCGFVGAWLLGFESRAALLVSVMLAMSSTAISVKSLQGLGVESSPGARMALAVAIFQDLFIIGFLVFAPLLLDGGGGVSAREVASLLGRALFFGALCALCARLLFPLLFHAAAATRQREAFTLCVVGSCIGLAWIGAELGLGVALGAFVAGLAVSQSVFKPRIAADVMPLKDLFLTVFFISVGLMVDLRAALDQWQSLLVFTMLFIGGKVLICALVARVLGLAPRQALLTGAALCSAGEFSLLLLQQVEGRGMWTVSTHQLLVAVCALSMGLLPMVVRFCDALGELAQRRGWLVRRGNSSAHDASLSLRIKELEGHAIIVGFGPVGRALNESLQGRGINTLVVDLNAETVQQLKREGQPVLFADAADLETWELARVREAALVAFSFADAPVIAHALTSLRELGPEVPVLARARFASDVDRLKRLGATVVINDEREASLAVLDQALLLQGSGNPATTSEVDPAAEI